MKTVAKSSTADFERSDEFITCSGKVPRRTSLDELPQLFIPRAT